VAAVGELALNQEDQLQIYHLTRQIVFSVRLVDTDPRIPFHYKPGLKRQLLKIWLKQSTVRDSDSH